MCVRKSSLRALDSLEDDDGQSLLSAGSLSDGRCVMTRSFPIISVPAGRMSSGGDHHLAGGGGTDGGEGK